MHGTFSGYSRKPVTHPVPLCYAVIVIQGYHNSLGNGFRSKSQLLAEMLSNQTVPENAILKQMEQ